LESARSRLACTRASASVASRDSHSAKRRSDGSSARSSSSSIVFTLSWVPSQGALFHRSQGTTHGDRVYSPRVNGAQHGGSRWNKPATGASHDHRTPRKEPRCRPPPPPPPPPPCRRPRGARAARPPPAP